jgi:hypothetical protein
LDTGDRRHVDVKFTISNFFFFPSWWCRFKVMVKRLPILAFLFLFVVPSLADDTNSAPPAASNAAPVPSGTTEGSSGKVLAPTNDVGIGSDGTIKDQDSYQVRIGELYAPGGEAYILPLRLPSLPAGQCIASIHLRAQLVGINNEANGLANADLYGLGVRDTDKVLPTDYYQGSKSDPKATLIQANFLTPASKVRTDANTGPFVETSADGDAALAKYLNDACAQPGNAGKYIFLRVSYDMDTIPTGNNAYMLLTGEASGDNEPPIFTYTLAPAPKN